MPKLRLSRAVWKGENYFSSRNKIWRNPRNGLVYKDVHGKPGNKSIGKSPTYNHPYGYNIKPNQRYNESKRRFVKRYERKNGESVRAHQRMPRT